MQAEWWLPRLRTWPCDLQQQQATGQDQSQGGQGPGQDQAQQQCGPSASFPKVLAVCGSQKEDWLQRHKAFELLRQRPAVARSQRATGKAPTASWWVQSEGEGKGEAPTISQRV